MEKLEEIIGYSFKDKELLLNALTHSSYSNERKDAGGINYERLEFLGDSILGFVTARHLYSMEPKMPEGRMTRLRSELVCEHSLYGVALDLGLGKHIRIGHGEEINGGRKRPSILSDTVEAIIAAMYLDGGIEPVDAFISRCVLSPECIERHHAADYKTELQELVQQKEGQTIEYIPAGETGPDHAKTFMTRVCINGETAGEGKGHTKKEAEQAAAKEALKKLRK